MIGRSALIVDAVRTPIAKGKAGGAYGDVHPVEVHAHVLRALIDRTGVDPAAVDDVIRGAVGQVGEQSGNTARWGGPGGGFPQVRAGRDGGSAVREQSAGDPLRRSGRDEWCVPRCYRVRGRVDESHSDRDSVRRRRLRWPLGRAAVRGGPGSAGHQRGADRTELGSESGLGSTSSPPRATVVRPVLGIVVSSRVRSHRWRNPGSRSTR
jgi:hypothetical protein